MPQLLVVKALMNYAGPLGVYTKGQEFRRPVGLKKVLADKPQHFKIMSVVDTERVSIEPPKEGARQIDITKMPGHGCSAEDKRMVRWGGNGPIQYAGHSVVPGTELIVQVGWLADLLKLEGFSQVRGKVKPSPS